MFFHTFFRWFKVTKHSSHSLVRQSLSNFRNYWVPPVKRKFIHLWFSTSAENLYITFWNQPVFTFYLVAQEGTVWDSIEKEEGLLRLDLLPTGASPTARFWFHYLIKSVQQSADYYGCQAGLAEKKRKQKTGLAQRKRRPVGTLVYETEQNGRGVEENKQASERLLAK